MKREIRYGVTCRSSKDGTADAVNGAPGPVGAETGQETIIVYPPWGVSSRMPIGGQAILGSPSGSDASIAQIGARHTDYQPDYADEDWTATLHNEVSGTWVKLRSDGGVQVGGKGTLLEFKADGTAKLTSGSGGTIELKAGGVISFDGGANNVIREGDSVAVGGTFLAYLNALSTATGVPPFTTGVLGSTVGGNPKVQA